MSLILVATVLLAWSVRPARGVFPVVETLWVFISDTPSDEVPMPASARKLLDDQPDELVRQYRIRAEEPKRYAEALHSYLLQVSADALLTAAGDVRAALREGAKIKARASLPRLRALAQTLPKTERDQLQTDDALVDLQVRNLTNRPGFVAAASAIATLERLLREADPQSKRGLSVAQLDDELARAGGVHVPYVEERLPGNLAVALISIALAGPYLFLLSLCNAISSAIAAADDASGSDWLFFHPGRLGPTLGTLWLLGPALTVTAHWLVVERHGVAPAVLALILASLALLTLRKALATRVEFMDHMERLRAASPAASAAPAKTVASSRGSLA